jgi:hypothetical protein
MTRLRLILAGLVALACLAAAPAAAQDYMSKPYTFLRGASTNSTLVYGQGQSLLQTVTIINTTAVTYFLKLYDKRTAPTCGTDTPVFVLPVPPQSTGGGVVAIGTSALQFTLGLGFCLVGGLPNNDSSNAATGVAINFGLVQQ